MVKNISIIPEFKNIDAYVAYAKERGLAFEYNDFFDPSVLDDEDKTSELIDGYLQALSKGGYQCARHSMHGAFFDVTIFSSDNLIREVSEKRIMQSMEIAKRINASTIVFHTNSIGGFCDDAYVQRFISLNKIFWTKVADLYPKVNICIENMFDHSPELAIRLFNQLEGVPNIGMCLDYAHVNVFGKSMEPNLWLEMCKSYVKHIHINDNNLDKDSHLALGEGNIDYKSFFEYYKEHFSHISCLIEVNGFERIKKSMEYIDSIC